MKSRQGKEAHRRSEAIRIVAEGRERAYTQEQNRVPDAPQRAQEAVTYAKGRNFEREAVIDQRDIMRDALRRGMGDLTFSQVRDNFEHRRAMGEFQTVAAQKHDTGSRLTTPESVAAERATIQHMQRGQ